MLNIFSLIYLSGLHHVDMKTLIKTGNWNLYNAEVSK